MITYESYLRESAIPREEIDLFLDPCEPTWAQFDPELGYVLGNDMPRDGIDGSRTISTVGANGMNRRERVLMALQHKGPDRVPVDLGAMDSTGIVAVAYHRLRQHLGMGGGPARVFEPFQQVAIVEGPILEWAGADARPLCSLPPPLALNHVHNVQADVPPANVEAMYEAVRESGAYT